MFAAAHLLGMAALGPLRQRDSAALWLVAAIALLLCLLTDTGVFGLRTPMVHRQTPQRLFSVFGAARGALAWGLDTGLAITTRRVTCLTWVGFTATILGLAPWWSGLAYAAGFTAPSLVLILLVPRHHSDNPDGPREPTWLMDRVARIGPAMQRLALVAYLAVGALCATAWFTAA